MNHKIRDSASPVVVHTAGILISLFSIAPILWVVSTALKAPNEIFTIPPHWIPRRPTLENVSTVLGNQRMIRYFLNTLIIASGSTIASMIISVLGAYSFARYRFPGSRAVLTSVIFSRFLPRVTLIIPFFVILRTLGLYNTYPGLVLVYIMIGMPISIWVVKGFFEGIPIEMEEAAIIDGCRPMAVLFRIVLPIAAPAVGAITMYSFILAWNEFLLALVLTSNPSTQPISVGLAFYNTEHGISWGPLMAASMLMTIPSVVVLLVFQRHLVRGLTEGAVKS
jgi:ABC-type glycerol-3-phosphate transport system permease component